MQTLRIKVGFLTKPSGRNWIKIKAIQEKLKYNYGFLEKRIGFLEKGIYTVEFVPTIKNLYMEYIFQARLSAYISLSDDDFSLLTKAAENHYDSTINETVKVGGYLYGEGVKRRRNPANLEVEFDSYRLRLALKSLETQTGGLALFSRLLSIAKSLTEEQARLNSNFKAINID